MEHAASSGRLTIISTPIGNLSDISDRARRTLQEIDILYCEDTRVTQKLLSHLGLQKKCFIYNDHATEKSRQKIIEYIKKGDHIGLVSDAGTPLISDPGYKLVKACYDEDITVNAVPGPTALIHALTLSGLPTNSFYFGGFPPQKTKELEKFLMDLSSYSATLIFYMTVPKVVGFLTVLKSVIGDRRVALCRELTKKFEEVRRGKASHLLEDIQNSPPLKGELVLVIEGSSQTEKINLADKHRLLHKIAEKLGKAEASKVLSELLGYSKKEIYNILIQKL